MLSKRCKYAVHALVYMAKRPHDQYVIKEVSDACCIPKKFLESILLTLKRSGILGSKQGKSGGYFFRRPVAEVNLAEVVRIFDGAIAAVPCATFKFYQRCTECVDEETCSVREAFLQVRNATVQMLKGNTLQDLVDKEKKLEADRNRKVKKKPEKRP